MNAINGRIAHGTVDPIQAMQLKFPLPDGEQAALQAAFEARLGTLTNGLPPELAQAVYTAYRAAWADSWMHGLQVRADEARAAMGCEQGQVIAVVTSRTVADPQQIGRRRA
jgi:hypothetical protein